MMVVVCLFGMRSHMEKRVASSIMCSMIISSTNNKSTWTTWLNLVETRVDVVARSAGRCHIRQTLQELQTEGMRSSTFLSTPAPRMMVVNFCSPACQNLRWSFLRVCTIRFSLPDLRFLREEPKSNVDQSTWVGGPTSSISWGLACTAAVELAVTAGTFGSSLSDTSGVVGAFGSNGFWDGFGISFSSSTRSACPTTLVLFLLVKRRRMTQYLAVKREAWDAQVICDIWRPK